MPIETDTLKRIFSPESEPSLKSVLASQIALVNVGHANDLTEAEEDQLFEAEIQNIRRLKAEAEGSPSYR